MNWKVFNLKYENREQWAFEQMSYLLFCAEFGNRIGLFRYKNQAGIETEPLRKDDVCYGFQAKYYTTTLSQNKDDIIDSIQKAKTKNSQLNVIYLYLNQELSESTKIDEKKPQYQIDIEQVAQRVGINVEWRVPSHFELQLSLVENKYINDIFFSLDPNGGNLIDDVYKHNENILRAIQTEILFNENRIKIDRNNIIDQIKHSIENGQNIIISGEGGCGKTAIFKDFYNLNFQEIPICIYKASELNVNHINDLFRLEHNFPISKFFEAYQSEPKKVFVIDSAERLAESTNSDIINNLVQALKDNGWIIIFTTRYSYLTDLSFHIRENYDLSCEIIDIPIIRDDELENISIEHNFTLPNNQKFAERIKNLFYLNEYIQYYSNIDRQGSFSNFVDLLWKKRIQNINVQKDNLHIERDKCIIHIAKERCETGLFYINAEKLPQSALFQLKQDEILGYDETHNGYFITHDIYEEWALNKLISRNYANHSDTKQFFEKLGDSLPIRRAFRLWLSKQLSDNINDIENFVQTTFTSNDVSQYWKDELLVSVLLSDYSGVFFNEFDKEIKSNDFAVLKRILFLLRIACKEEDTHLSKLLKIDNANYIFTKPKGKGWDETIKFIYSNKENIYSFLSTIISLLEDWNNNTKRGETTRISALSALYFYEYIEKSDSYSRKKKQLIPIILNGALEIKEELKIILEKNVQNKWVNHSDPYYDLCHAALTSNDNFAIAFALPEQVLKLADLFWFDTEEEKHPFGHSGFGVEKHYSIRERCHHDYSPGSALQTPIHWLLESSPANTIDFILNFTNKTIEKYAKSDAKDPVETVDVVINDKITVQQYINQTIWCMYRGSGGITKPHLLESIHMALERFLLKLAKEAKVDVAESYLIYLLQHSKSTSITAIVTSVVLAYPEKFFNVATILFRTLELFHIDGFRQLQESQAKQLYSIGYGMNKRKDIYADERLKTCEAKHRNLHLESLFFNYQYFGVKDFTEEQNTEFINSLHEIIDQHKKNVLSIQQKEQKNSFEILLSRMDRRNLSAKVTDRDENSFFIEFTPKNFPDELKQQSERTTKQFENVFKYSSLRIWADFMHNKMYPNSSENSKQYDDDPLLALTKVKQLVEELKNGRSAMGIFDYSIPGFVCSKLIIEHRDILSQEDKDFCREIILSYAARLFSDDYDYQISDGVEAAIHAIPFLISEYPDEKEDCLSIMVFSLFDKMSIGQYKRICDYAIESIHESKIWESKPDDAQSILLAFIKLKPIYDKIYNEKRKEQGFWGRIPKSVILQAMENEVADFSFTDFSFDIHDMDLSNIHDMEIIYQLIPSNTRNNVHLEIYERSLPLILPKLLIDRRDYKDKFGDDSNIYLLQLHIFRRFARFMLEREINEIDTHLQPFIDNFGATEETSLLLDEIVTAEDYNNKYEQFWYIWNKLYPKFSEICNGSNQLYLDKVTISYLLAWRWWRDGIEEWHSLQKGKLSFYANIAKDSGHNPAVLYSIVRVLNTIGSKFVKEGIDWIHTIVSNNTSLKIGDLESNTLYYLERFMRKFIFMNKQQIKQEIRLKNKAVPILEFMIERGSIHGYLLRESIL